MSFLLELKETMTQKKLSKNLKKKKYNPTFLWNHAHLYFFQLHRGILEMKTVAGAIHDKYEQIDRKPEEITLKGHTKSINCLSMDEFNRILYSASKDGSIIKCKCSNEMMLISYVYSFRGSRKAEERNTCEGYIFWKRYKSIPQRGKSLSLLNSQVTPSTWNHDRYYAWIWTTTENIYLLLAQTNWSECGILVIWNSFTPSEDIEMRCREWSSKCFQTIFAPWAVIALFNYGTETSEPTLRPCKNSNCQCLRLNLYYSLTVSVTRQTLRWSTRLARTIWLLVDSIDKPFFGK